MDLQTLQKELAELTAQREAIQKKTAPLKEKREALSLKAIELNQQADAISAQINQIYADNDFMALSTRRGRVADAIMTLRKLAEGN